MNIIQFVVKVLTANKWVLVKTKPDEKLLISMATRYDHCFGISGICSDEEINKLRISQPLVGNCYLTSSEKKAILSQMKQLHEEVVGTGFYKL